MADAQAPRRRRLLHPGGDVHGDAADAALGVDASAEKHRAGVDADAQVEPLERVLGLEALRPARRLFDDRKTGADRTLGIVLERALAAEHGQQTVAGVLQHLALLLDDDRGQPLERAVHHRMHVFRIEVLAQAGGADDVHDEDGDRLELRLAARPLAQRGELFLQRRDGHADHRIAEQRALRLEVGNGRFDLLRVVFHAFQSSAPAHPARGRSGL